MAGPKARSSPRANEAKVTCESGTRMVGLVVRCASASLGRKSVESIIFC